ncbi:hypothetical protein EIL87_18265 [Saccharopolyspora rhizosphaerae]|uniref:DUF5602 domain-containing protein n=1 Tax=Saccharopolyspora rhizosphaerae TaxID=2492662 RepID=A0A3R8P1S1_9PSEU|nr:hypothetical protein [Saccharopolyspora rhizosphaerae]RRO14694.1 hypothetical protein EIL87_18265 [Saccharopolyspora rhizosphaerae]
MKIRFVMAFAGALVIAAGGVTTTRPAAAEKLEWVCAVSDREQSLLLPGSAVDRLVATTPSYRGPCAEYGESAPLGDGTITAYTQFLGSRPVSIGVRMSDASFSGLPQNPPTDGTLCFDKNGDGSSDPVEECSGGYGEVLELGEHARQQREFPFTYILNNWNPHGHIPLGVYDKPHYDVHFYLNDNAERLAIRPGPCPQLVHCDDYELGKRLPEPRYVPADHTDADAIEPAMGNHLVDPTAPEFNGQPFRHTWIYGTWNREVTYYEPMISLAWLDGLRTGATEDGCHEYKQPAAWQGPGWYPTTYCTRHSETRQEVSVSLEDFVHCEAS